MSKFLVEWCEVVKKGETNGRAWQVTKMTLKGEDGVIEDVKTFDAVQNGATIEGEVVKNEKYGGYDFKKKLDRPDFMKKKEDSMTKVMEKKEQSISRFQDSKEWSIKVSSTMRDAVILAVAEGNPSRENVLSWRNWLWDNFDVELTDKPPF